jgi:hypothetical protein
LRALGKGSLRLRILEHETSRAVPD